MELQNVRRLGVFKLRNIGDVLMITPVLRALRETFPDARITAVVNSGTEAMLAHNPHVDEVIAYQRGGGFWKDLAFAPCLIARANSANSARKKSIRRRSGTRPPSASYGPSR